LFNAIWPTLYNHEKTQEFEKEILMLSDQEIRVMNECMREAIKDAQQSRKQWSECRQNQESKEKQDGIQTKGETENKLKKEPCENQEGDHKNKKTTLNSSSSSSSPPWTLAGAIVVDPKTNQVVSSSSTERCRQQKEHEHHQQQRREHGQTTSTQLFLDDINPLCTPVLLAIQGVSRLERSAAIGRGMDSEEFQKGQYLCTGYDVYTTREPNVYESMALVHSRVRRVIFGVTNSDDGGLGGSGLGTAVHCLPGTNHHYRAFRCCLHSDGNEKCSGNDETVDTIGLDVENGAGEKIGGYKSYQDDDKDDIARHEVANVFHACVRLHSR